MINEFSIIKQYFTRENAEHPEIIQGIGDDAAVWQCNDATLVTAVDTLLEGRHFFPNCKPEDLAYKALAVNLSDFAAMGATPRWFTLALTLPVEKANDSWLQKFSEGLFGLANEHHLALIGGDTTRGPLSVTIQVFGTIDKNKMLLRSGAGVGDKIYVSNYLGDAAVALHYLENRLALIKTVVQPMMEKLNRPKPQLGLGYALAGHASAAIDISDGLAQDLNHILTASGVGAVIELTKIPVSYEVMCAYDRIEAQQLALIAGDDYQLCFTLPVSQKKCIEAIPEDVLVTCIGEIVEEPGLKIMQAGQLFTGPVAGFMHFGSDPQSR